MLEYELEYGIIKEFGDGTVLWYEAITDEFDGFVLRTADGYVKKIWENKE